MITAATCLAMAVYYEARGENLDGMTHVAQVIVNRKNHSDFPDTICGVVKEDLGSKPYDCQFSFYCDGKAENPRDLVAWSTAKDVASMALSGDLINHGATYFHAVNVKPYWASIFEPVGKVGNHIFYVDLSKCELPTCSLRPKSRPVASDNG